MTTPDAPPIALAGEPDLIKRICDAIREAEGEADFLLDWEDCIKIIETFAAPSPSASSVPAAIPEGWRMRIEEGAAVVQKERLGGVVVHADDNSIAAAILHALATDILAAPPANTKTDWLPTAANINALPEPIRDYIMGLETNADPAGMVRENAILRHDNAEFESRLTANPAPSALTDEQITDALQSAGVRWHWIGADHAVMSTVGSTSAKTIIAGVRALLQSTGEPK